MRPVDTARYRERLLALRADLEAPDPVADAAAGTVELDQASVGRLSRMDALQAQQMALAAGRRRQAMRSRVSAALARLDAGEFGECADCGEPIDPRRLDFDPTSVCCLGCAEARDRA